MKNFWFVVVSVIRSLFNNEIRTPRRVKGRCARVENLENRLALSASLPASDVALIREAFLEENVASLMGEYGSSSAGTMSAIDLSALIETAILDEDGALFDEGYEQTEFGSTTPVNLSVNNEEFTTSALEVGATGAMMKDSPDGKLLAAMRRVFNGETVLAPEIAHMIKNEPDPPRLTERQIDILHSLARGQTNRDIALQMGLKPSGVRVHIDALLKKLGAATRTEAIAIAMRRQLIKI